MSRNDVTADVLGVVVLVLKFVEIVPLGAPNSRSTAETGGREKHFCRGGRVGQLQWLRLYLSQGLVEDTALAHVQQGCLRVGHQVIWTDVNQSPM